MNYKTFFFCTILSGIAMIAGCDNDKSSAKQTSARQESEEIKCQEIQKYNEYVATANYRPYINGLAESIEDHEEYVNKYVNKNNELTSYYALEKSLISGKIERLEKALAIKTPLDDLDAYAEKYLKALKALEPVNEELSLYADTKEYLSDEGKLFHEKEPQLLVLLKATVAAEDDFENKITEHDAILVKKQFEAEKKDTFLYYRNGIIYYEKVIVSELDNLMTKNDTNSLAKLEADTNELNTLYKGYLKTKNSKNSTCDSKIKSFIARSRTMSEEMKKDWDKYTEIDPNISPIKIKLQMSGSSADQEYKNLMSDFNYLIRDMNADRC